MATTKMASDAIVMRIVEITIVSARIEKMQLNAGDKYRLQLKPLLASNALLITSRPQAKIKSQYKIFENVGLVWTSPFGLQCGILSVYLDHSGIHLELQLVRCQYLFFHEELASTTFNIALNATEDIVADLMYAGLAIGELHISVHIHAPTPADFKQQLGPAAANVGGNIKNTDNSKGLWDTLFKRLKLVNDLAEKAASFHPYAALAWGVVSAAYKIVEVQQQQDARILDLLQAMVDACDLADTIQQELKNNDPTTWNLVNTIMQQVTECIHFIQAYCVTKSFTLRLLKHLVNIDPIPDYIKVLCNLKKKLAGDVTVKAALVTLRVAEEVSYTYSSVILKELRYAKDAHYNFAHGCLEGTRTDVIQAIAAWALGAYLPNSMNSYILSIPCSEASRVLWICGPAGCGKTSIIRSAAALVKSYGRMGSFYGFSRTGPGGTLSQLFSTIACDIAQCDKVHEHHLVEVVKGDAPLRNTGDPQLQFEAMIAKPMNTAYAVGPTVVFIDAFDEADDNEDLREDVLNILCQNAVQVPENLRIIVTSRLPDVVHALYPNNSSEHPKGVNVLHVDRLDQSMTCQDVRMMVEKKLHSLCGNPVTDRKIQALVGKADISFQWASTACRLILKPPPGSSAQLELDYLSQPGAPVLANLYYDILERIVSYSRPALRETNLKRIKIALAPIQCARHPLQLSIICKLVHFEGVSHNNTLDVLKGIYQSLSSLLTGTLSGANEPIIPFHASIMEFFGDKNQSAAYYLDSNFSHAVLLEGCYAVMRNEIHFNMLQTPHSGRTLMRSADTLIGPPCVGSDALQYAAMSWSEHLAAQKQVDVRALLEWFYLCGAPWEELGFRWLEEGHNPLQQNVSHPLVKTINDILFEFYNYSNFSPAQTYLSALPMAASKSPLNMALLQPWLARFPGIPTVQQLSSYPAIASHAYSHVHALLKDKTTQMVPQKIPFARSHKWLLIDLESCEGSRSKDYYWCLDEHWGNGAQLEEPGVVIFQGGYSKSGQWLRVDFRPMKWGSQWAECYDPNAKVESVEDYVERIMELSDEWVNH
ncbi:hypothetical protein DL93DRAFT_2229092 [Clavulina sp. PMI_390]|nr:hypothetical protein DL93DRAFT_2229092 [Clavulina sp. PMI_390]